MLAYRITIDKNEIDFYKKNKIYYDNKPIFNIRKNSLYKVNTFICNDKIGKYFYYFPLDAYEIAKIVLRLNNKINNIYILEYELNNNEVIDKFGFGNYRNLKRKDYIPQGKLYKIHPYDNSTYPVLELKMPKTSEIRTTNNIFNININDSIPSYLNRLRKLREYILYKIYLEKVMNDFDINYPHSNDGLMIISKQNNNVKELFLPKKYQKLIC